MCAKILRMKPEGMSSVKPNISALFLLIIAWFNWSAIANSENVHRRHFSMQNDGELCGVGRFQVNEDTIIRAQDSKVLGAKYINETELPSQGQCLAWCCQTSGCNVAVYEEKDKGSCYLFDCGPSTNFKCKFTTHSHYSSAILDTSPPNNNNPDNKGIPPNDEHIVALKNLKNQVQQQSVTSGGSTVSTQGGQVPSDQRPTETETISKPTPTTTTTTSSVLNPGETSKPTALSVVKANEGECTHFQFQCRRSGECIAVYNACDGIPQCSDGSDESEDLGCPTDGRRYPGPPTLPSVQEKPNSNDKIETSKDKQPDKHKHVQSSPENEAQSGHHQASVNNPQAQRTGIHTPHRPQKQNVQSIPKSKQESQSKDPHISNKFDDSYSSQAKPQNSDSGSNYRVATGHQPAFSRNGDGQSKANDQSSRYDNTYHDNGNPIKPVAGPQPQQSYHRQFNSGTEPQTDGNSGELSSGPHESHNKGQIQEANEQWIPSADDGSRHYYEAQPPYENGRQEDSDTNFGGQYGPGRGYVREYYEGGYAPSNTDYASKGSQYQQQDGQYVGHEPLYGHHSSDGQAQVQNQNWSPHQTVYEGRKVEYPVSSHNADHQGTYIEHRYNIDQIRPESDLGPSSDHGIGQSHDGRGRQNFENESPDSATIDHELNPSKFWPQAPNHNTAGQQSGSKKASASNSDGAVQSNDYQQHSKQDPLQDDSYNVGGRHLPNIDDHKVQLTEELRNGQSFPPTPLTVSEKPITKETMKTAAKPQHRVSHVEVNLAEVELTKAERSSESSGAILALTLGLSITGLMLVLVGCRLRMVRRRLRRGRSPYAHDADYLVNGMYL